MRPLSGIRVVTIAVNVPGPLAVSKLRDAGAQVTKVEPPDGDPLESFCASWYRELHDGITTRRLDLKSEDGAAHMRGLLADTDLFIASQRPAALARLGLDSATLLAPGCPTSDLRWLNIVGECQRPEVAGHDLTYLARAGLLGSEMPRTLMADVLGAESAFARAVLLLHEPPGTAASVGLFDSLASLTAPLRHGLTRPGGLLGGGLPAYGVYPARNGRVAIAALEPHFRANLYSALGRPEGTSLGDAFRDRSAAEWETWARERDLPLSAVAD
jgi:crotonobetainyl-CoA:carnitine CoA-transferase CaiB-like acyl-CoA transferase